LRDHFTVWAVTFLSIRAAARLKDHFTTPVGIIQS
jgi:hypothetical protein